MTTLFCQTETSLLGYGIGLFYVTPGGQIMLEMVDHYGGTVLILALAAVEVIAINWVYGTNTMTRDFNFMLNIRLSVYWRFCWGVLCPLLLPILFLYMLFTQAGVPNIPFPAQVAGWCISLIGIENNNENILSLSRNIVTAGKNLIKSRRL